MAGNTGVHPLAIDLHQFKLHTDLKNRIEPTLHFNLPSRKFYLSGCWPLTGGECKKETTI